MCVLVPELWNDGLQSRKNKKKDPHSPGKKKKPVIVSDILCNLKTFVRVFMIYVSSWQLAFYTIYGLK